MSVLKLSPVSRDMFTIDHARLLRCDKSVSALFLPILFVSVSAAAAAAPDLLDWNRYRLMRANDRAQLNRSLERVTKRSKLKTIALSRLSLTDDFDRVEWLKYRRAFTRLCRDTKARDCLAIQSISKLQSAKLLPPFARDPFLMARWKPRRKKSNPKTASYQLFDVAVAEPNCGISADEKTFTSSSGNKVQMDFGMHYDGQTYAITDYMLKNPDVDPQYVQENVKTILEHNREVIANNKDRASEVRKLVMNNQIQWIGVELSPEQLERKGGINGIENRGRDLKQLLISKGVSSTDAKDYVDLYFSAGGGYFAYFNDPEVRKKVRPVAIDDEASKKPTIEGQERCSELYDDLRSSSAHNMDALDRRVEEGDPLRWSDHDINQLTEDFTDPTARAKAKEYLSVMREIERLQIQRNAKLAENSLNQGENGLISLGSAHTDGVIDNLKKSCDQIRAPNSENTVTQ